MRWCRHLPFLLLLSALALRAPAAPAAADWNRVTIAPMKTSIYVGSVTLTTAPFERRESTLTTTYDARVFPWFFWSENGRISITLSDAAFAQLAKGETAEFTGDAFNQKNKPRKVTGRAQPADTRSGKIKVRIHVDDVELIFNGTYKFAKE